MKFILSLLLFMVSSGCVTNSGVVQMGPDTYMISREASTGFQGLGTLKADNLKDAGAFCSQQSKFVQITNATEVQAGFAKFPRSEVNFMCLDKKDADLARPKSHESKFIN